MINPEVAEFLGWVTVFILIYAIVLFAYISYHIFFEGTK